MRTCIICRYEAQPDDVLVLTEGGRCICLVCWRRETEAEQHPMPRGLRKELDAVLAGIFVSDWWEKS